MESLPFDLFAPHTLPSLPWDARRELPHIPAIYFVLNVAGTVLYIGRTVSLKQRFLAHHKKAYFLTEGTVHIAWFLCEDVALLDEIERALIRHFRPRLNRARPIATATVRRYTTPRAARLKQVVIRMDEAVLEEIRVQATANRRSLNGELRALLDEALSMRTFPARLQRYREPPQSP